MHIRSEGRWLGRLLIELLTERYISISLNNGKSTRYQVALAHEEIRSYDAPYYETQLVRVVEGVLSPLGWEQSKFWRECECRG